MKVSKHLNVLQDFHKILIKKDLIRRWMKKQNNPKL